jgi:serine/threonine protein kinase
VPIAIGTRLGLYEITALLGKGGMGEVYRATDPKLKREVAIKILPDESSQDLDRVNRFQREAEVLASLNHPNIAAIYDLQEVNGLRYLVLELVGGETLAERIQRGAIPIEETLNIAKSICEGLEAAHERGVVHRDLKPANVKFTPEGNVKVLDFGLAKASETSPTDSRMSNSPTMTALATNAGIILGTAAYMSPEQAKGLAADPRSDIFSFGCVLYEMLTGRQPFQGDAIADVLASVLAREPDLKMLPANLNPRLLQLLQRTLAKNPKRRFHAIADVRFEIEEALNAPTPVALPTATSRQKPRLAWIVALAAAAVLIDALAIPAVRHLRETSPSEMRVEINTPATPVPLEFALSPDGRYIVFVASGNGLQRLWLRALDKTEAQAMAGTEGADYPFWSPDSRSIGFFATRKLKRIDIAGGSPQTLADSPVSNRGGTWNADGVILFSASLQSPLLRISASGGEPVAATRLDPPRRFDHRNPQFLPDGRHFLFYAFGTPEASGIYLGSLNGEEPKRLAAADTAAAYLAPEMIVFVRGTALMAQHLDLNRGELTGDPMIVADPVGSTGGSSGGFSSVSGRIAYRSGAGVIRQLKWYDWTGKVVGEAGELDSSYMLYPELSPNGRQVAIMRGIQNNNDIWLMDLLRGGMTRFTFDPANDVAALWSPDGMRIAFQSNRKGPYDLFLKPSSGTVTEELLLETPNNKFLQDWSKDGRFLLYAEADPKTDRDLWALPVTGGDRKPMVVVKTPFEESNGQFSPDGRWVAYETNESGQFQVVVQPFSMPSSKWPVSTGGGTQPRWSADGKELYFIAPDEKLMAVSVTTAGTTFAAGTPVALFAAPLAPGGATNKQQYAVSRDGRFLLNQPTEASTATPITLILNWRPDRGK